MGVNLAAKVAEVDGLGAQAKVKFALLTGLTKDKAMAADDSAELLAKADGALAKVKAEFS